MLKDIPWPFVMELLSTDVIFAPRRPLPSNDRFSRNLVKHKLWLPLLVTTLARVS